MLGQGTFGQVAKCWDAETNSYVAAKVIKNQPAFYQQAIMEVSLLSLVRSTLLGSLYVSIYMCWVHGKV
jgi:serine/threonine protein kinase